MLSLFLTISILPFDPAHTHSKNEIPEEIKDLELQTKLGNSIDLNTELIDESGESVQLKTYFKPGKPVLLSMVYYRCPTLCNFHLSGLNKAFKEMEWNLGEKFEYIAVSIDSTENFEFASQKKEAFVEDYLKSSTERTRNGWHFLTGNEENINALAKDLGFPFKYNQFTKQWIHPVVVFVLTPDGKISRYLPGIEYGESDLRLSVIEASGSNIGNEVEKFMMFFYKFDPVKNRFTIYTYNMMLLGSGFTVLVVGSLLFQIWRKKN
jgi:protein SCO1/2